MALVGLYLPEEWKRTPIGSKVFIPQFFFIIFVQKYRLDKNLLIFFMYKMSQHNKIFLLPKQVNY